MDIVCISTTDWGEIWGSRQQIMTRLAAAGNRVLFVERQVSIEHLLRDPRLLHRKVVRWRGNRLRKISNNLWLWCPPLIMPGRYYSMFLNFLGQRLLANQAISILHAIDFDRPVLWIYPPQSFPLLGRLGESISVYHCIDRFAGNQKGLKRAIIEKQENQLLKQVDLVFTHSDGLRKKYAPLTRHPIMQIPSAADVNHFQSITDIHPDITAIHRPHIGIMGTFDGRLDVKLLHDLATNHPYWQFIFIGQIRPGRTKIMRLFRLPNVHYLGDRPFRELPSLLNGMDVFLIAYKLDELTKYINPLKLYEYLAIGKPIVSVPLPEVLPFSEYVQIASPDKFADRITNALQKDTIANQQARREIAKQHTWDNRVQKMVEAIEDFSSPHPL